MIRLREDLDVYKPFEDLITKEAHSPQLFSDP